MDGVGRNFKDHPVPTLPLYLVLQCFYQKWCWKLRELFKEWTPKIFERTFISSLSKPLSFLLRSYTRSWFLPLTTWIPFVFGCRVVVLESRPTENPTAHSNLYILAGHENSYWATLTHRTTEGIGHTGTQERQETGTCRFLSRHRNCVGFWGGNQSIFAAGNSWFCLLPLCGWLYRVCLIKAEIKSPLLVSSRETEPWNMFCSKGAINC